MAQTSHMLMWTTKGYPDIVPMSTTVLTVLTEKILLNQVDKTPTRINVLG